jgi:hypothetical protein
MPCELWYVGRWPQVFCWALIRNAMPRGPDEPAPRSAGRERPPPPPALPWASRDRQCLAAGQKLGLEPGPIKAPLDLQGSEVQVLMLPARDAERRSAAARRELHQAALEHARRLRQHNGRTAACIKNRPADLAACYP